MKLVINACHGGFTLSDTALELLREWTPDPTIESDPREWTPDPTIESRSDPRVVEVVERLGSAAASGPFTRLKVVEIPDGVEVSIEEYDGLEWVAEKHRTWR